MVILRRLGSWLALGLLWLLHWLPTPVLGSLGRALGRLLYRFGRGRVTEPNPSLRFPEKPEVQPKATGCAARP